METTILKNIIKSPQYPFLAQYQDSFIVLFTSENVGMVIQSDDRYQKVGEYSKHWTFNIEKEKWRVLENVTINFKS